MSLRKNNVSVEYKEYTLEITYDFFPGFRGSREEPPEPASIELESVRVRTGLQVSEDILPLMSDEHIGGVIEAIWEKRRTWEEDDRF